MKPPKVMVSGPASIVGLGALAAEATVDVPVATPAASSATATARATDARERGSEMLVEFIKASFCLDAGARSEARAECPSHERRSVFRMYCSTATKPLPFDDSAGALLL